MQAIRIDQYHIINNQTKLLSIVEGSVSSVIRCSNNLPNTTLPSLPDFMSQVINTGKIPRNIILIALIYVFRLKEKMASDKIGQYETPYKIFLASIIVAYKYSIDGKKFKNIEVFNWSKGLYTLRQINDMERSLVTSINYDLRVDNEELDEFCKKQGI